jgi:hypothetical protein
MPLPLGNCSFSDRLLKIQALRLCEPVSQGEVPLCRIPLMSGILRGGTISFLHLKERLPACRQTGFVVPTENIGTPRNDYWRC